MAIPIKTHLSQIGGRGLGGASPVRAGADSFGAQSARAGMEFGQAVSDSGKVLDKILLERKSTDMLEKENALRDKLREFDTRYRSEKQGKDALSAEDDYRTFLDEEITKSREGIRDPRVLQDFDRRMGAIRAGALDGAARYRLHQENAWKTDTLDAQGISVMSLAADPNIPDEEKSAAFEDYQRNTLALFPGLKESRMAKNEADFKDGIAKSYMTRIEGQVRRDPAEAMKTLDAALTHKATIGRAKSAGGKEDAARGIRNNNPGNIRISARNAWQGAVAGTDEEFVTFATPEHGIRAIGRVLNRYAQNGVDTVDGIISRWAPASENDTKAYIKHVADSLGVSPNAALDMQNPETLAKITKAIITQENGKNPYSDETIAAGVMAALGFGGAEAQDMAAYLPEKQLAVLRDAAEAEYKKQRVEALTKETANMPPVDAMDWIAQNEADPEIQGSAIRVQQNRQAQTNWRSREDLNKRLESAYDAIKAAKSPEEAQRVIDSFPPEEQAKLDTVARRRFSGELTITDKAKMGEFITRLANNDTSINLKAEYGAYFSDTDMAAAHQKLTNAEVKNRAITASQLFDMYAVQSGMKDSEDKKRAKAVFLERIDRENATKPSEQKKILFDMFRETTYVDGGWFWFDKNMPAWKAREKAAKDGVPEEDIGKRLVPVPASKATIRGNVRAEIVKELKASGYEVNEKNVRLVFERYREAKGWM